MHRCSLVHVVGAQLVLRQLIDSYEVKKMQVGCSHKAGGEIKTVNVRDMARPQLDPVFKRGGGFIR